MISREEDMNTEFGGFFFAYRENMFVITSGDYLEFPDDMAYIERQKIVKDRAREQIEEFRKKQGTEGLIYDSQILIFWRNVPKTFIDINNNEYLFYYMCQKIKEITAQGSPFKIYVDSVNSLAEGSVETFIRRLCMLYQATPNRPIFLDSDIAEKNLEKEYAEATKYTEHDFIARAMAELFSDDESDRQYENIISFLNMVLRAVSGDAAFDTSSFENENFITQYLQWQLGIVTVEMACITLGNMSRRTFYKYVAAFEESPLYAQFMYLNESELRHRGRKGYLPEDWDDYLDKTKPRVKEISPGVFEPITMDEIEICKKYNLYCEMDIERVRLAVEKKAKAKKKREEK